MNVKNVADNLLTEFDGLRGLSRVSPFNLRNIEGIGKVKADVLTAAFELGRRAAEDAIKSPDDIYGRNMPNGESDCLGCSKAVHNTIGVTTPKRRCGLSCWMSETVIAAKLASTSVVATSL